jgi:peptidoglycan/LPS O-acetylase OafA/YrhL
LGWRPATDTIANALLVHSVLPSAINSVVPGGWSIGVEVAFYFVFPLLARAPAKWLLPMALLWYGTFGIAAEHWLQRLPEAFLYYSPLTQLPVFLIGMHIYHRVHSGPSVTREVAIGLAWLLMALVAKHYGWPGRPVFWVAVFILAVGLWFSARYHLGVKLLQFFGRLSYSMYLVHFAVLDLVVLMLPRTSSIGLAFALVTAGAVAVGLLSYRTGERWSQDLARQLVLLSSCRSRRTAATAGGAG